MRSILKRIRSKRSFTLLEILICMALLLSLSAIFAIEGKKFLDTHRFKTTLELLKTEGEKARFQSLIYRTDIELELLENKGELVLRKKCDEPVFSQIKTISLPGVTEMRYQGKKQKKIAFAKFSCGYCVSSEKVELRNKKIKEEVIWNFLQKHSNTAKKSQ
jgi:prepilin-type N-terminal cleavage/methylation domain-containing protein